MKSSSLLSTAFAGFILFALSACGHNENPQTEQLYHYVADRPIVCQKGNDCQAKWARAVQWVHARTEFRTKDGREIHYSINKLTSNLIEASFHEGKVRIMKLPREDGSYIIDFTSDCDLSAGCYRTAGRLMKMDFVSTMIGLPPGVTQTSPNTFSVAPGILPAETTR